MKPTLTPQEYFAKIKLLRTPEEIKALCEQLTSNLFNETDKPKTRVNKLTPYNKLINTIPNEELVEGENAYIQTKADGSLWKRHLHFQFTGLSSTKWHGEGGINTKTIVLDRLENRRKVDVTSYLETVSRLLLSDDPHELAVGLIGASGRRPVEILVRGKFTLAVDLPSYLKPGYFVNFKGQAKKRDYDIAEDERAEYRIGVLVPAESFLTAFKRFRQMAESKELAKLLKQMTDKGFDAEEINKKIEDMRGNSLRRVVAREFGAYLPERFGDTEINNKSLRAVYVRLITDRDCPKNISDLLWASRAVGHFIDNQKPDDNQLRHLLTTLGYSDYYADTEVRFMQAPHKPKAEKAMQVRVLADDFEEIKQLQQDWELPNQQTVVRNLIELALRAKELEAQLLEAKAQITQLKKEKEEMQSAPESTPKSLPQATQPQSQSQVTPAMVKQMIAEALAEALPQLQAQTPNSQLPISNSQRQSKSKAEQPEKDWESVSTEELKASKHRGAAEEKIRRSFLAITSYNNAQPSNETRWAITNQTLRQLSGCNGGLVAAWMERYKPAIDDHNNKYGFLPSPKDGQIYHNKKHEQKISEHIKW